MREYIMPFGALFTQPGVVELQLDKHKIVTPGEISDELMQTEIELKRIINHKYYYWIVEVATEKRLPYMFISDI